MPPLAVYIHWPYCARICPYCDFNVYKQKRDDALLSAIIGDLKSWRVRSGPREIISIHFGGGTPSLMSAADVSALIDTVKTLWGLAANTEIAIEANPGDADKALWNGYSAAGINRLSLGVQSFDDAVLKRLGRDHDGAGAKAALELAMSIFPGVSADMIFGHIGQTVSHLDVELETLLSFNLPHISAYQLTIEEGTAFARAEARGQRRAVDGDTSADLYERVCETLGGEGYNAYEVSNHAKTGHQSRHNLAYWQGHDYVGVGPGAHGRLTVDGIKYAAIAALSPDVYGARVAKTGSGLETNEPLSPEDRASEYLMMGLRIKEGISLATYTHYAGTRLSQAHITALENMGLIVQKGDRLAATRAGRLVLNTVSAKLLGA